MIEVKNLCKNYGSLKVLRDISFQVKDGEVLGFLGPNGAGKTTMAKIITGLTGAGSGWVKINGLKVSQHSLQTKKQIGYLPESVPLYNDMTVLEYLSFIRGVRKVAPRCLEEVMKTCGLEPVRHRLISYLSKGFQQRTCLAQALIHNPQILILDEPTSGLDPNQIVAIRKVIKKIGQERTVILSTHILQEVEATCDRVVIIDQGKVIAKGTTKELAEQARGSNAFFVKIKGGQKKVKKMLSSLSPVTEVLFKGKEGERIFGFQVKTKGRQDIREMVFEQAVKNKMPLLEMKPQKVNLEGVFRKLTRGSE